MTPARPAIHPARLSACLGGGVPAQVAARLLDEPRFATRIDALLLGPDPEDALPPGDAELLAMPRDALEALAARAGAVVNGHAFIREIRGPVIAERTARFGEQALADARALADLAMDRPVPADPEALAQAIRADGVACLAAWLSALPPTARRRVGLAWPDDDAMPRTEDAQILRHGAQIMRRLAVHP